MSATRHARRLNRSLAAVEADYVRGLGSRARHVASASPAPARALPDVSRSRRVGRGRGDRPGIHVVGLRSALKSATGPRCASLSGLTIELMPRI